MSKPIFATPTMDRAESKRIYGELRETQATGDKAKRFREADGVFERAQKRAQDGNQSEKRQGRYR